MSDDDAAGGRGDLPTVDVELPDGITIRPARADDADAVAAFTADTWSDREGEDYIPRVFEDWVADDGPRQRTLVAVADDPVGLVQIVFLSEHETWAKGMRVAPAARGRGIGVALTRTGLAWAADRGATVCRNMVFSWNVPGLGVSRAAGFGPGTEFRWAHPEPADRTPALPVRSAPAAAWTFWTESDARDHLRGTALDDGESWAVRELTPEMLRTAADERALFTVTTDDAGTRAMGYRTRTYERTADDGTDRLWAEYGLGAWADVDAAAALYDAIAADAAALDADRTRVFIPEGVRWVSDTAACRVAVSDEPDFVMRADLTGTSPN